MSSCETPRHSTNAIAPFSRARLSLTIALLLPYFPTFGDPAGASSDGALGGRARALIGDGAQLPRTLLGRFGWSGSQLISLYQARLSTDHPIVLAVQHSRPPRSPLSPPPPPPPPPPALTLTSRALIPLP